MKIHTASDGHILTSYYEYLFDEYLYCNNIAHDIDDKICSDSRCRYDFKIGDVYVEIWGISKAGGKHYNNYCQRRIAKEALYKKHNLTLVSIEGLDFRRSSDELQKFFKLKLEEVGVKSKDNRPEYPIFNRRKIDYWNDQTVINELKQHISKYGKFPTANDLLGCRNDLRTAIRLNGGFIKFAVILGFTPQTKPYSENYVVAELELVKKTIGHFPCDRELQKIKRSDLASMIKTHGGYGHFKELIEGDRDKKPFGYWSNEDNIINELTLLTKSIGRFPKYSELGHIAKGIDKSKKGMKYFKDKTL